MRRFAWMVVLLVAGTPLVGCSSESSNPATATGDVAQPAESPDTVVNQFLTAVQAGDDATAEKTLTAEALKATQEEGMVVSPPGSSTAQFKVGPVEIVEGGAHVLSTWTDGESSERRTDEIIWVLKIDQGAWRIAGMITKVFPDLPPVVLDFEDPADMQQQQRLVQEEFVRRAEAEAQQVEARTATNPAAPPLR